MHKYIIAVDPSGNFSEGKGTTGICVLKGTQPVKIVHTEFIQAKDYMTVEQYWQAHVVTLLKLTAQYKDVVWVIEDYLLYRTKAENQINSRMETPKLIGILQYTAAMENIPTHFQTASEVKTRWNDDVLMHKHILYTRKNKTYVSGLSNAINKHVKDAIRHGVHYCIFKNRGDK